MKQHGNLLSNPNLQHLYEIFKIADQDTINYDKFDAQILLENIPGRAEATRIEREHIDAYFFKNGRNPLGNLSPKRK